MRLIGLGRYNIWLDPAGGIKGLERLVLVKKGNLLALRRDGENNTTEKGMEWVVE